MRISDWSSDVCSSDLVPGRESLLQPADPLRGDDHRAADRPRRHGSRAVVRAAVHGAALPGAGWSLRRRGCGCDRGDHRGSQPDGGRLTARLKQRRDALITATAPGTVDMRHTAVETSEETLA